MKPLAAKSCEADYLDTPPSYGRHRQVLFSQKMQGLGSAAVSTVTIRPTGESDPHSHGRSDEFWIVRKGHGKIIADGNGAEGNMLKMMRKVCFTRLARFSAEFEYCLPQKIAPIA